MPEDQMRLVREMWDRYQAPIVKSANEATRRAVSQGLPGWDAVVGPQIQQMVQRALDAADYPRLAMIRSFTFARGGWHDAPLSEVAHGILVQLVDELADKPDEQVKAELDHAIPDYFANDGCRALWNMVEGWDLYPGWRQQVFEEAFWAHKNGKYVLSVSALAPQIEGMLRQTTDVYYGRSSDWIEKVNEALDFDYHRGTSQSEPTAGPTAEELERAVEELGAQDIPERFRTVEKVSLQHALFRVNQLYNYNNFAEPEFVNSTNRHAILHGVAEDFGEVESVKLFCAVELVHNIVGAYEGRQGDKHEAK